MRVGLLLLLLLGLEVCCKNGLVLGSVHEYAKEGFQRQSNAFVFHGGSEGLHASVNHSNSPDGASYIRFESIVFQRTEESIEKHGEMSSRTGLVEAIVFEVGDRDKIGSLYDSDQIMLCCTPELEKIEGCNLGEVIKHNSDENPDWPKSIPFTFQGKNQESQPLTETIEINKTGMYNLYFIFCDPDLQGTVITSGKTIWKNPTGYLPGRMAPMMSFYYAMSLAYLVLGLVWLIQYSRFWRDILQLQNCITLVIGLGMCEMVLWYFEYTNFNATGYRPIGITLWAVTFGAIKKTVSRFLLLVVSMGYGVVRPTLGGLTSKVLLLGIAYFVAAETLDVVENVGAINDLSGKTRVFLVLPVAILDAFFILWIFTSLSKTLEKLQVRKSYVKLELYRKFTNSLAVAVIVSIAWIGFELYFKSTDPYSEHWQIAWIITAFWNILTFILLTIICTLWSPSQNSTRYAYSEEAGEEFDEEEAIALTSVVAKTSVAASEEKLRNLVNKDVFSIEDDPAEDKRD